MKLLHLIRHTAIAGLCALPLLAGPARSDVITYWNAKADAVAAEKQMPNVPQARGMAMLHLAMFDAVNAIERRYAPYKLSVTADRTASREAAASAAAFDVLVSLYPDQKDKLESALVEALSTVTDPDARAKGVEIGQNAAAEIIALRKNDGIDRVETYRPHGQPGVYVPTVVPIESASGALTPWVMTSGSQFRPGPPPALTSETWTKDLNEIREYGRRNSTTRSAEQTEIARFWFLSGPRTYNPIVRQVAVAKQMDVVDCARLFALASMAGNDAFIAVFDAKYAHNFWRPITAIRNADLTSNAATPREAAWQPLGATPMHPEYPCAHCIASAAVSTVLQLVAGNEVGEIALTSPTAPGVTRKWTRLSDYADEVSNARIYAGFHYRFSTLVAKDMGRKIGELTVATRLQAATAALPTR